MAQETPSENWGEVSDLNWNAKKDEVDAFTGRKVEPLEESEEEREKLNKAVKEVYEKHQGDHPEDGSEDLAA